MSASLSDNKQSDNRVILHPELLCWRRVSSVHGGPDILLWDADILTPSPSVCHANAPISPVDGDFSLEEALPPPGRFASSPPGGRGATARVAFLSPPLGGSSSGVQPRVTSQANVGTAGVCFPLKRRSTVVHYFLQESGLRVYL